MTTLIINIVIIIAEIALWVTFWTYLRRRSRGDQVWLEFLKRALSAGLKYTEIESIKPLYIQMTVARQEGRFLQPERLRSSLLRFLSAKPHDKTGTRQDVRTLRRLTFARHTEELLNRNDLDQQEPISVEAVGTETAVLATVEGIGEGFLDLRLLSALPPSAAVGTNVVIYLYRPASGAFLLGAKIDRIAEKQLRVTTDFQFVHAEERHFMADLVMRATLCINMVPLIRVKELPATRKERPVAPVPEEKERIRWRQLDPHLGIFPAETVRISDRGVLLQVDETKFPGIDKNFLNRAYLLTLDFPDGEPLEATGHLLSVGRHRHYLFRFGELSAEAHRRLNDLIRANNPQQERLA